MTLQEYKDLIAQSDGYENWEDLMYELRGYDLTDYWCDICKHYAQEKVKQVLELAAQRAKVKGIPMDEGGYLKMVDADSILSLEAELVNNINKEI